MATWSNTNESAATWTEAPSEPENLAKGMPIGLLLALTYANTVSGVSWIPDDEPSAATWTAVSET